MMSERLAGLDPMDAAVLRCAAVVGRSIDFALLQEMSGATDLESWAQRCAKRALLEPYEQQFRFTHEKVREYSLEAVSEVELPALHRTAAQAIEARYPAQPDRVTSLAAHWRIAGDAEREINYCFEAASQSLARGALSEAVNYFVWVT